VIGITGGTISVKNHLGDTLTLEIPPAALDEDTSISVTALSNPLPSPIAQNLYPGALLEPEGLQFSQPVSVTISLHDALNNPNSGLLFWLKDSSLSLPIANQTRTPNSVAGQSFHFSPFYVALPTSAELAALIANVQANPPSTLDQTVADMELVNDYVNAELTYSSYCLSLGLDELSRAAQQTAAILITALALAVTNAALPPDPCGLYTVAMYEIAGDLQALSNDFDLSQAVLARACSLGVSPTSLFLTPGQTLQPALTATLTLPYNGGVRPCPDLEWLSMDKSKVDVISTDPTNGTCGLAALGVGTTVVFGECDSLSAHTQVSVCSATGTWSGSWSGSNGGSGPVSATLTESAGSFTGTLTVINLNKGQSITVSVTGTDSNGSLTFGPIIVQDNLGLGQGPGEVSLNGSFSADCTTISGSFVQVSPRVVVGSFTLVKQ